MQLFLLNLLIKFVLISQRKWFGEDSEKTISESTETDTPEERQEKASVQKWRHIQNIQSWKSSLN